MMDMGTWPWTRRTIRCWLQGGLQARQRRQVSNWTVNPYSGLIESSKLTHQYQLVVGLEIHAQLNLLTKLFSNAALPLPHSQNNKANDSRCLHPFDAAVPGTLPVLNGAAVRAAVLSAAALQCQTISEQSRFERKHYAYADLPHGYQITQQRWPLARNGLVECTVPLDSSSSNSKRKKAKTIQCRIHRIQLEMDTGKTTTTTSTALVKEQQEQQLLISRVDCNRAGAALLEIVTEPDLRSSLQAVAVVRTIRQLLQHCDTCRGRMESGQLRVDCNVNVIPLDYEPQQQTNHPPKSMQSSGSPASPRVEIKNLNSLEQVRDAIEYEAKRHAALLSSSFLSDEPWVQEETRTWNVLQQQTELIRRKDAAEDYRFLPEPDLPPLVLNSHVLQGCTSVAEFVQEHLPELPAAAVERLQRQYGLTESQACTIASDPPAIAFFDAAVPVAVGSSTSISNNNDHSSSSSNTPSTKMKRITSKVANLLCNELLALVKENQQQPQHISTASHLSYKGNSDADDDADVDDDDDTVSIRHSKVTPQQLGEIVLLLEENVVSTTMAKKLLALLYSANDPSRHPRQVATDHGLHLVTDPVYLRQLCRSVIVAHPDLLAVYRRGGKFVTQMQKLFMGKVMEASHGNAHPERLREILWDCLAAADGGEAAGNDNTTTKS